MKARSLIFELFGGYLRERGGAVRLRGPDLPAELLAADWPGAAAHRVLLEAHELLGGPAQACVDGLLGAVPAGVR